VPEPLRLVECCAAPRVMAHKRSVSAATRGGGVEDVVLPTALPAPVHAAAPPLKFSGESQFRARCVLALLTGKRIRIDAIRHKSETPGLAPCEASFLRLLDRLTNGTKIEINETGTVLRFSPGLVIGGAVSHDCSPDRAIGWYVEGVLPLLPFAKKATTLALTGVTDDGDRDLSVDILRTVTLPLLFQFGLREGLELKVAKRGCPPLGGGAVTLTCQPLRSLTPINLTDEGLVRKVRGVAFTARVSPATCTRIMDSAR
jgi:RNA 3'-terminal phosphate cyclase-like protein